MGHHSFSASSSDIESFERNLKAAARIPGEDGAVSPDLATAREAAMLLQEDLAEQRMMGLLDPLMAVRIRIRQIP